jgi:hypothetical protein
MSFLKQLFRARKSMLHGMPGYAARDRDPAAL